MNNFSWAKGFGFGVFLWLIMFVAAAVLVGLNIPLSTWSVLILAVVAGVLAFSFAVGAKPTSAGQAFGYGFLWAAIGIILDVIFSRQLNSGIFGIWSYWLGYAAILLAPWFEYEIQNPGGAHHHAI